MHTNDTIYVAGHRGLVGSAIVRRLEKNGDSRIVTRTSSQLDLRDQKSTLAFFEAERPTQVYLAAAKVGGIQANSTYPADFIRDNLLIQTNVIDAAYRCGANKLLFLGSSCIYPKLAPQPISEAALLSGPLEPTNEWYAVAKIAGIKLCQAYKRQYGFNAISVMPTNLYGPGDNYDLESSHVIPALIRKFHEAKISGATHATVWGTGTPRREFLHVDDLAEACVFLMEHYNGEEIVNIGTGEDATIAETAALVAEAVGFKGELRYDTTKPDGTPRKQLDVSKIHRLGWMAEIPLQEGLADAYAWFLSKYGN